MPEDEVMPFVDGYDEKAIEPVYFVPGGVGIDVGANVGVHSLAMAEHMALVYAIEPDPTNFLSLLDRLGEAGASRVVPVCRAFGGSDRVQAMRSHGGQTRPAGRVSRNDDRADADFRCVVSTLDDFCRRLQRVDVIKIDVEGSEIDVLAGADEVLWSLKPSLVIENHEEIEPGYGVRWSDVEDLLLGYGYRSFQLTHCNFLFRCER